MQIGRSQIHRLLMSAPIALAACSSAGVDSFDPRANDGNVVAGEPNSVSPADSAEPATAYAPIKAGIVGGPGDHYTLIGRFDTSAQDRLVFSFPNSKIGVRFNGTSLAVVLSDNGNDAFDVTIDSNPPFVIEPTSDGSQQTYLLAENLPARSHTAWLSKRTEGYATANDNSGTHTGATTFFGFDIGGGTFLTPPGTRPTLIEAIGDSAFSGYGANDTIPSGGNTCTFTPMTENASYSTPLALADALGSEVINISAAGKGIVSSVYNTDPCAQIPSVYLRTVQPNDSPAWGFGDPQIAAVIVQAGANDLAGAFGNGYFPSRPQFVAAYANLLATIRQNRPSAAIVCVLTASAAGNDKVTLKNAYIDAIGQRAQAGDLNIHYFDYFDNDPNGWTWYGDADGPLALGTGCEGHPSQAGATFLAGRLAPFLRTIATFN